MNFAVLDYDGFICKSFFAAQREEEHAEIILSDLTDYALEKAKDYFDGEGFYNFKIVSGHSWKKDLYPDYKKNREKDPYVGAYRDYIIDTTMNIYKPATLEADELCIMIHDYAVEHGHKCIVFSDDKDLRYSSLVNCKVNLTEQTDITYDEKYLYQQMLAGDKEDDIQGIKNIGMKKAEKLLEENGCNIEGVIKTYIDKQVSKEECLKQLNLIIPMKREFNSKPHCYDEVCRKLLKTGKLDEFMIKQAQIGQVEYLKNITEAMYG